MNFSEPIPGRTPLFTSEQLESYGFTVINTPTKKIGNLTYEAKTVRLLSEKIERLPHIIDENEIINKINQLGWKHIFQVVKFEHKLYGHNMETETNHVQVIARGF